ncbi:MAG: MATE family efflux transporter [Anaerolineae bacterium]|nr:MATE family efflux transporter [Gloeobacterales cyanobacterium ES-bin-313]
MVPLAGLVDVAFLGHLTEIRNLAGVALATVLFDYLYWTFGFLRMGTTGLTAQANGRGDGQAVLLTLLRNGFLALAIGLGILLLQWPIQAIGFGFLRAEPGVLAAGRAFYNALIWSAPATLINYVLIGWFLGREQSSKVLLLSVVSNVSNIVFDYLFIVRWGWESTGAGVATALSQYLTLGVGFLLLKLVAPEVLEKQPLRFEQLLSQVFSLDTLTSGFALNRDLIIRTFAIVSVFAAFTNLGSAFGTVLLATNAILLQVLTLGAYFVDGLAFATESLAGFFKGSGQPQALSRLLRLAVVSSIALGLGFAGIFNLFPVFLLSLISDHSEIVNEALQYVFWLLPILGIGSVAYMLDGYLLGLTESKALRNGMLLAAGIGFCPVALIAWNLHSAHLLWFALMIFMMARVFFLSTYVPETLRNSEVSAL